MPADHWLSVRDREGAIRVQAGALAMCTPGRAMDHRVAILVSGKRNRASACHEQIGG
jgi:hypothetical protein